MGKRDKWKENNISFFLKNPNFLGKILQEGNVAIGKEFAHGFDNEVPGVVLLVIEMDLPR